MRAISVFGAGSPPPSLPSLRPVTVSGRTLACGIVEVGPPRFEPHAPAHRHSVLVRVRAVSCNYRDRAFFHIMGRMPGRMHCPIGSEFAAEVVAVGAAVTSLRPGDPVIPNHHYVEGLRDADGVVDGVITNRGSRELQVFHERKLIRTPGMRADVAAGFSLNAQTAYSMVRRSEVKEGDPVLVTSASSNTSLFLIKALRARGAIVYASTSSPRFHPRLEALGARRVFALGTPRDGLTGLPDLQELSRELGGFHAVLDPFFDLHLGPVVPMLRAFGRYITCGFAAQNPDLAAESGPVTFELHQVLARAISKNLSIIGNCLGVREDLEQAVADHAAGKLDPIIDSVFTGDDASGFLDRTFNDRTRFGKVVFRYAS